MKKELCQASVDIYFNFWSNKIHVSRVCMSTLDWTMTSTIIIHAFDFKYTSNQGTQDPPVMPDQGCVIKKWKGGLEIKGENSLTGMRKGERNESRWKIGKQWNQMFFRSKDSNKKCKAGALNWIMEKFLNLYLSFSFYKLHPTNHITGLFPGGMRSSKVVRVRQMFNPCELCN